MKRLTVFAITLLSVFTMQKCDAFSSCSEVKKANARAKSGEYEMKNSNDQNYKVYCEFHDGHGYMFFSSTMNIPILMSDYCYSRAQVLVRHLRTNRRQYDTTMGQISSHHDVSLSIQYNKSDKYQAPQNYAKLAPYIFLGFLPAVISRQKTTQGYAADGRDFTFKNCDGNPNSYLAFFFNTNDNQPTNYYTRCCYTKIMRDWIDVGVAASTKLPFHYFFQFEMHLGGCGGYAVNGFNTLKDVVGAALGLRFDLD